jgi:hypothetical protein
MKRRKPSKPLRRIVRALAGTVALAILGCVTLVFALRWVDPPTSAFMLREHVLAGRDARPPILRIPAMADSGSGDGGHRRSVATQAG